MPAVAPALRIPARASPAPAGGPRQATTRSPEPSPARPAHRLAARPPAVPLLAIAPREAPEERQAERIAAQVMRGMTPDAARPAPARLHRACAACAAEEEERVSRAADPAREGSAPAAEAPDIVHATLRRSGRALEPGLRERFEQRFGHDFGRVRIHTDPEAGRSAEAVRALAYTVGRSIVFAPGRFRPETETGRHLLAHELAHVVQNRQAPDRPGAALPLEPASSPLEAAARATGAAGPGRALGVAPGPRLMRADPDAVSQILKLRTVVGAGIQFFPTNVTDTRIGPVSAQGGLISHGMSRLTVIIGQNLTPHVLARELLPLWTTATPFTPAGGGAPVGPGALTEDQLAQALLVYNQYYLRLPGMTEWRAGLHFPLPVDIEDATGIATVNADLIRALAGGFDAAWTPLLDQRAAATVAPPAATVTADVTAFLAAETTVLGRGTALAARALANAQASLPFIREAFAQLGAGGFEVALAMADTLVNRDLGLLAAQRDGAAILAILRTALAAAPAGISADQRASLDRANAMLARVAGVVAAAPSAPVPTRAEKVVSVDTVKLVGSTLTPATLVAVANAIYAQCNVRFTHGVDATATAAQTTGWLGADNALNASNACGSTSAEERALFNGATAAFGLSARIRAFFVQQITGVSASGYSYPPYCATGAAAALRNTAFIENSGDDSTLGHEIGHILLNSGAHPSGNLMQPRPRPNELTDPQCATIYANA